MNVKHDIAFQKFHILLNVIVSNPKITTTELADIAVLRKNLDIARDKFFETGKIDFGVKLYFNDEWKYWNKWQLRKAV